MDVKKLREKRQKLEHDIGQAVSALVEKFKEETEFAPNRINIDMVNVSNLGDKSPESQFIVAGCYVDIGI